MPLQSVQVPVGDLGLAGVVTVPPRAGGLVVMADDVENGHMSPSIRATAEDLVEAHMGTLLVDLVHDPEETEDLRFDIAVLGARVTGVIDWIAGEAVTGDLPPMLADLPLGCFGAGTGGSAALIAAANRADRVRAVVARGGRADVAGNLLARITAPTLLIVAEHDEVGRRHNEQVLERLGGESRLEVIAGATSRFEEPGALERVAELARDWFLQHLGGERR